MPRFAIGVTLTPEVRAQLNLPPAGVRLGREVRQTNFRVTVDLPDRTTCMADYRRFGARAHQFLFGAPLQEAIWERDLFENTAEAIQEKAQEFAAAAFAQAMMEEQRLMRCKSVPRGAAVPTGESLLKAKTADTLAGCYAVCIRSSGTHLSAVGAASADANVAVRALTEGSFAHVELHGAQRLVVGICCRYRRRFLEPRLLPFPRAVEETDQTSPPQP